MLNSGVADVPLNFRNLHYSRSGASAAEYAIIVAFVSGVIVVGATLVGSKLSAVFASYAVHFH